MAPGVVSILDSIDPSQFATETDRFAAKEAARRLLARLQTPFEQSWAIGFENPGLLAGIQLVQDLGIWTKWAEADKQSPGACRTLVELLDWATTGCEPNLLRRFLRNLASLYLIDEVGIDTWKPTPFSLSMGQKETYVSDLIKSGYKEPLDIATFDNHRDVFGSDFFTYSLEHPEWVSSLQGMMLALANYKMAWTKAYDTKSLVAEADLSKPLFVDVGGGSGLDTQRLLDCHPDLPADILIVQDLPEVLGAQDKEKLDSRIRKMPHDFFEPQPVTGARAYFFHAVAHDWPDSDVTRMFSQVKRAMTPGYSKLLICELVLPTQGASSFATTVDLALMSCVSGLERTEVAWSNLLKESGFKVVSISRHPRTLEAVIEAEIEQEAHIRHGSRL